MTDDGGTGGRPSAPPMVQNRRRKATSTVFLDPDQLETLRGLSRQLRRPMAELIREGVDLALEKHAPDSGVKSDT